MLSFSRRILPAAWLSIVLSVLCGTAIAAEPSPEITAQRVTPENASFSIEFPGEPSCAPGSEQPDCFYEHPSERWILRVSYWTVELSGPPIALLQKQLAESSEEGHFQAEHLATTRVGGCPALDYRFESNDGSEYRSTGRLVLIGNQLVHIEVGGDTLPPEETIRHFMDSFRVKVPSPKPLASPATGSPSAPAPLAAT